MTALSSYTLLALQNDLYGLLGDFQQTRYTLSQANDAINFSLKHLCDKMGYTRVETPIPISQVPSGEAFGLAPLYSATLGFDLRDYIRIPRVYWGGTLSGVTETPFYELTKTTLDWESERNANWRTTYGTPIRWGMFDGQTIFVTPWSSSLIQLQTTISLAYLQAPALLVNPTDAVDSRIPYQVQQYIKYAAASWLLSLDQSDTTSLQTAQVYLDTFNKLLEG